MDLFNCVDDEDYNKLSKYTWTNHNTSYAKGSSLPIFNILLHQYIMPEISDGFVIDHINRAPWDNRRKNLRIVSISENICNCGMPLNPPFPTKKEKEAARTQRAKLREISKRKSNINLGNNNNGVAVRNKTTGLTYINAKVASRALHIDHSGIGKCCKGKNKFCGGYEWEYVEERPYVKYKKPLKTYIKW